MADKKPKAQKVTIEKGVLELNYDIKDAKVEEVMADNLFRAFSNLDLGNSYVEMDLNGDRKFTREEALEVFNDKKVAKALEALGLSAKAARDDITAKHKPGAVLVDFDVILKQMNETAGGTDKNGKTVLAVKGNIPPKDLAALDVDKDDRISVGEAEYHNTKPRKAANKEKGK